MGVEGLFLVLFPEEGGVVEARAQYALVAFADDAHILRAVVADADEVRHKLAVRAVDREVALVLRHREDEHLGGDVEEFLLKASVEGYRVLVEVHVLFEQLGVDRDLRAELFFYLGDSGEDHCLALLGVGDDEVLAHRGVVGGCVLDFDGFLAHEAVPARGRAALDSAEGYFERLVSVERDEPADGTREADRLLRPVHALREGEAVHELLKKLREHLGGGLSLGALLGDDVFRVSYRFDLEGRDVYAAAAREALRGLRRVAVGVEGLSLERPFRDFDGVVLTPGDVLDLEHEAARRAFGLYLSVGDVRAVKLLGGVLREVGERLGHKPRGDFFGSYLKQKVGHYRSPPFINLSNLCISG